MDVKLHGIHTVRRKLADGSVRVHRYAWRGGPKLDGEPGSVEFLRSYNQAQASKTAPDAYVIPGTLGDAIKRFKRSGDFSKLSERTQREYSRYLSLIELEFSDAPLSAFNDPQMRGEVKEWRDDMRNRPRTADYAVAVFKRLLSWLMDNGELVLNVAARMGRLHRVSRAHIIWTEDDHAKMAGVQTPLGQRMAWAMRFACLTGLRRSSLVAIPYSADQGGYFDWISNKTHRRVIIPILPQLRALLDEMPETTGAILRGARGEPMTPDGFSSNFDAITTLAGVDKHIHDARGTFATALALAGTDDREIAGIIGWSPEKVAEIRRVYVDANSLALRTAERFTAVNGAANGQSQNKAK